MNQPQELLSPKIDFVFKALFGNEQNRDLLLSLINAVLNREEGEKITEAKVLPPELEK